MRKLNSTSQRALFGLALCAFAELASAVALGKISVKSVLGAHFHAEVQLIEPRGSSTPVGCFRLEPTSDPDSEMATLYQAQIDIRHIDGGSKLIISSSYPIYDPVLQINLRTDCGTNMVRNYTVFLEPPMPISARNDSAPLTIADKSEPIGQRTSAGIAAPDSWDTPKMWVTIEGESAHSIARSLFPDQRAAQRRFLDALASSNPDIDFGRRGEAVLKNGITLSIPDLRKIATEKVANKAPSESSESKAGRDKSAGTNDQTTPTSTRQTSDRLVVSGDENPSTDISKPSLRQSTDLSTQLSQKISENTRNMMRIEYKLLSALHDQAARQLGVAEKVRNLEASLEQMQGTTDQVMDEAASPAPTGQKITTEPSPMSVDVVRSTQSTKKHQQVPAAEKRTATAWWLEISIVLLAVSMLTWWLMRRSRKAASLRTAFDLAKTPTRSPKPTLDEPIPWPEHAPESDKTADPKPDPDIHEDFSRPNVSSKHVEVDESGHYTMVLELTEIMISFGRTEGAIQVLRDYIDSEPHTNLAPWIKLLEIFRANEMRDEFDLHSVELNKHFNITPESWDEAGEHLAAPIPGVDENDIAIEELLKRLPMISTFPHIKATILNLWNTQEGLNYINHLLRDTREGQRNGFPLTIAYELLFLADILNRSRTAMKAAA